jgi:signal transduction histidine kinase
MTWIDITEAKRLRENMEFYVMQITRIQEEERKRIAQELHEDTLQSWLLYVWPLSLLSSHVLSMTRIL